MRKILGILLCFNFSLMAEVSHRTEAFLTSRYRTFPDSPYAERNQDNFLFLRHELTWSDENYKFLASPFIVLYNSQLEKQGVDPVLTNQSQLYVGKRQLDIEQRIDDDDYTRGLTDFQEIYFGWTKDTLSADVGRRVVALGNLKLLPLWNKFNPTAVNLRPTWFNGVDHLKLSWQGEKTKVMGYAIADQTVADRAQFVVIEHFLSPSSFSVLAGTWWEANTIGASVTIDVLGWLLKLETLSFQYLEKQNALSNETQAGLGVERSFAQDWNVNIEYMHQSQGAKKEADYIGFTLSPHQDFRAESYAAAELRWTPSPFYTYTGLSLYNVVDHSLLYGLIATRQWDEIYEFSIGLMSGSGKGELGQKATLLSPTTLVGVPSQVDLTLKAFF